MKKPIVTVLILVLTLLNVCWGVWLYVSQPKIVYVRTPDLIEKYQGTLEARKEFEQKKNSLIAHADSMARDFERNRNAYVAAMNNLSVSERKLREQQLNQQQVQVTQYGDAIETRISEEDARMMQEVLNQVNSFVESHARVKGYSLVLGTTASGSLLYAKDAMDVTDELLEALNKQYKGQ